MATEINAGAMYTEDKLKTSQQFLRQHAYLVKKIAFHLKNRLPANIQIEDLIQAGMIGLIEATKQFDDSKGAAFETYANIRIRGAILDEIRKGDWAPRSVHRNTRKIAEAVRIVENQAGRDAKDKEVAEYLAVSIEDYHAMLQDSLGVHILGFDDIGLNESAMVDNIAGNFSGPIDKIQQTDFKRNLAKVVHTLSDRERLILSLYYEEELNLRQIGDVLGVSESRVSQIHTNAMDKLQAQMQQWSDS